MEIEKNKNVGYSLASPKKGSTSYDQTVSSGKFSRYF